MKFIHRIILFAGFLTFIGCVKAIYEVITNPKEISIPVRLNLQDAGTYEMPNGEKLKVSVKDAHGQLEYSTSELTNAPIHFWEIAMKIIRPFIYLLIIYLLHKFMQTTIKNEPFNLLNARRIQWIGITLILLGLLKATDILYGPSVLRGTLESNIIHYSEHSFFYYLGFATATILRTEIIVGLCVLFFSKIIKHGILIREENALTI